LLFRINFYYTHIILKIYIFVEIHSYSEAEMYLFETSLRVRYGETDQMGYVYYGNYSQYYEIARVESMRNLGLPYKTVEENGYIMPVVSMFIKYVKPAFYDEITLDTTKKWDYTGIQPDVVVINLISNDLSAPVDSAAFANAYLGFVKRVRNNYAGANIVCVAGPSAGGEEWRTIQSYMHAIVDECQKTDANVDYFAFTPVAMNGSDWHPNVAEHRQMADELVPYLTQLMNW